MLRFLFIALLLTQTSCALNSLRGGQAGLRGQRIPPQELDTLEMLIGREPRSVEEIPVATHRNEDLSLGMGKSSVESHWGQPQQVEVAGNPEMGFERWTYQRNVPTIHGYTQQTRVIYFENGNVVGWESR